MKRVTYTEGQYSQIKLDDGSRVFVEILPERVQTKKMILGIIPTRIIWKFVFPFYIRTAIEAWESSKMILDIILETTKNANGRDLDGDDLMNQIFGCDNQSPKIKFNELKTSLDKAEQRGLMNLFKGIVGIRDKKAHLNFIQNDPLKTTEYLSLASLLTRLLDENTLTRKRKKS